MKYILTFFTISVLAACSDSPGSGDKRAELESLKKQQADLKERISTLEAELSAGDTAMMKSKMVAVTEMNPQPFHHYIEVQARVEGDQDVLLSAEAAGTVTDVYVRAGDQVTAGKVLAAIDDNIVKQSIAEMQSQLDLATQLFNRQKNLWDQKIGSEVQFLQAKTNKEAMEKRMSVLQEQLDMTRIKSPINGTVDNVEIKKGQTVAPGMPAINVVNLSSLRVKAEVAESFISRVKKGDDVILFFPDQNKEVKSKIDYSGKRIDPLNRTFNVEVRLKEKDGTFHPNMVAVMKIIDYTNPKAFVIPVSAVQKSMDGEFVYVASTNGKNTVAKRKIVETGMTYNGQVEIKSGLDENDKVITQGFQNVIEGDAIKI